MVNQNKENIKKLMPCLLVLFVLSNLMVQAFVTVSPAMATEFSITASKVSIVVTMSTIVLGVCSVVYGALSDYIPIKKLLIFGISMFIFGSILGLLFQKIFYMVVIARMVQTLGQAAISSLYLVIASKYLEGNVKIKYFAYFTACFQIAQSLGVLAGGVIATYISWNMLFPVSLISILFVPAIIKYAPIEEARASKKIDIIGISLFSAIIVLLTLMLNDFNTIYVVLEVLLVVVFLIYIQRNNNAFITPKFFKENKQYSISICLVFMIYFSQFAFAFLYTFIVSTMFNNALDLVSYILLPGYIAAAFIGGIGDKITKRLGKDNTIKTGILLLVSGLLTSAFLMSNGKLVLTIAAILFFVGYNMLYSPLLDKVTGSLPANEMGRGIGLNDLIINVSSSFGVAIASKLMISKGLAKMNIIQTNNDLAIFSNIMFIFAFIAFISFILFSIYTRKKLKTMIVES